MKDILCQDCGEYFESYLTTIKSCLILKDIRGGE